MEAGERAYLFVKEHGKGGMAMDTIKSMVNWDRCVQVLREETPIESAVPVPADKTLGAVLCVCPQLQVEETAVLEGRVKVSGTLALHIVAEDEERRLFCFDAAADFTHTLKGEGLTANMQGQVTAGLLSCDLRQENGGLRLYALLGVTAIITESLSVETISYLSGGRGVEQKTTQVTEEKKLLLGAKSLRLREENGVEEGTTLLGYTACLTPLQGELVGSSVGVEGTLCWELLLLSPNGKLTKKTLRQPFTETVSVQGAGEQSVFARGEVTGLQAVIRGEALLTEADVSLSIYGHRQETLTLLEDAYDETGSFACEKSEMECLTYAGSFAVEVPLGSSLSIPAHMPESEEVLFSCALPALKQTEGDRAAGSLFVTTVYRCPQGLLHSFTSEIPFETALPVQGACMVAEARVLELTVRGTGRTLTLDARVLLEGECFNQQTIQYTSGLRLQEPAPGYKGLLLYFTEGGESFFSLGKQFHVSVGELQELNPGLQEPMEKGTQVLLLK